MSSKLDTLSKCFKFRVAKLRLLAIAVAAIKMSGGEINWFFSVIVEIAKLYLRERLYKRVFPLFFFLK